MTASAWLRTPLIGFSILVSSSNQPAFQIGAEGLQLRQDLLALSGKGGVFGAIVRFDRKRLQGQQHSGERHPAQASKVGLPAALGHMARVLVSGGKLVGTFPFAYNRETTITKALHRPDGEPELLAEVELHGDPVNPKAVTVRKRTSTPEHALASETPTAKSKGLCQTGHGDVRP